MADAKPVTGAIGVVGKNVGPTVKRTVRHALFEYTSPDTGVMALAMRGDVISVGEDDRVRGERFEAFQTDEQAQAAYPADGGGQAQSEWLMHHTVADAMDEAKRIGSSCWPGMLAAEQASRGRASLVQNLQQAISNQQSL